VAENSGFDVRVTGNEADDMVRALRSDFDQVRTALLRYGLELTLAGELLAVKSGMTERNAAETASRCLAISRLASLLESSGVELPQRSITLEAEWHRDRLGSSIVA
jgi:hypothetical protein